MSISFSAAQVEQFKRNARRLSRQLAIPYHEAQDRIAAEHGLQNWSVLAKHSESRPAPPLIAPRTRVKPENGRRRYYLHGDQAEDDPATFFCRRCDLFVEAAHFDGKGWHADGTDGERYLIALDRWNALPRWQKAGRARPDGAPNILSARALTERAAYEASRSAFHRWLEAQRGRDDPVGDLAGDAMRDKDFPVSATTRREVQSYVMRRGGRAEVLLALRDAWSEFKAGTDKAAERSRASK